MLRNTFSKALIAFLITYHIQGQVTYPGRYDVITRYDSCLQQFDEKDQLVRSSFSSIFEEGCDLLEECYKQCLDLPTKDECDDDFQEFLEEKCDEDRPVFFNLICKRKAKKWFDFVQDNADDYYEKVKCVPCFLVIREDTTPEAQCITNTIATSTSCSGDAQLWYAEEVDDGMFLFQNKSSG